MDFSDTVEIPSVAEYFRKSNLDFTATSSEVFSNRVADNALEVNKFFESKMAKAWWIVHFPKPVFIHSYSLGVLNSWDWHPTQWKISFSQDGEHYSDVQIDGFSQEMADSHYVLRNAVYCQYFRVDGIQDSLGLGGGLAICNFDAQARVIPSKRVTCKHVFHHRIMTTSFFLFLSIPY